MKTLEKILVVCVVIELILKFSLMRGADELIMLTLTVLAGLYYTFSFLLFNQIKLRNAFKRASYQGIPAWKIILAIVTGIALSIVCMGSLFKLLHMPGADQMLIIGLPMMVIIAIVAITGLKKDKVYYALMLKRTLIASLAGILLLSASELDLVRLQYRNHPDYINAYVDSYNDPKNEVLYAKKRREYYKVIMTNEEFKLYESTNR
jgi:hypothetical protein